MKRSAAQEIVNYMGSWTRMRQQDQSVGFQLANWLSGPIDVVEKEVARAGANAFLTTFNLEEIDILHRVDLPVTFDFDMENTDELQPVYGVPTVRGRVGASWYDVSLATDNLIKTLIYGITPTRISLLDQLTPVDTDSYKLLTSLAPTSFPYTTELTHHLDGADLYLTVEGDTNYIRTEDGKIYRARILLTGISRKGIEETEMVVFPWAMTQQSLKEWKSISRIELFDFPDNTIISLASATFDIEHHLDVWNDRFSEADNKIDTFWGLEVVNHTDPVVTISSLTRYEYISDRWQDLVVLEPAKQSVRQWDLLDTGEAQIESLSVALRPFSDQAWVLDSSNMLYCYDIREEYYQNLALIKDRTPGSHVQLEPAELSYSLHNTIQFLPVHIRPEKEINRYRIWYQTPSGTQYGLLDSSPVAISSDFWVSLIDKPLSRTVGRLQSLDADEYGEYLFVIETLFVDGDLQTEKLLIPVLSKTPLFEVDLTTTLGENALAIEFSSDQLLWVKGVTQYHCIQLHNDRMIVDFQNKTIFTPEAYDELEVTVDG